MKRIASGSQAASAPASYGADVGTPGFFQDAATTPSGAPTQLTPKWCNMVQAGLVGTIEDSGATPADTLTQFQDVVAGVHAIKSGATTTGTTTTARTRSIVASDTCAATAATSATVGSSLSLASGVISAVVGSGAATASGAISAVVGAYNSTASGAQSVVIGGSGSTATAANSAVLGGNGDATGPSSAVIAGDGSTASGTNAVTVGGINPTASGDYAAVSGGANSTASGTRSFVAASNTVEASGAEAVILASAKDSTDVVNAAAGGSLISGYSCHLSSNATRSVVLASHNVNMNTSYSVGGGVDAISHLNGNNNDGQTWRIESSDGDIFTDGTAGAGAADFAEMFENAEPGEIPAGSLVARTGRKVRLAAPGDRVVGVVSAAPAVLGGSPLSWPGRYERDEWGRKVPMAFDGIEIPTPSADYDPTLGYVRRTERPDEWTPVALVGQVRVRIGAGVQVDDLLAPGPDGCAVVTIAPKGRTVEVMEIVQPYDAAKGYGVALCLVG